MILKENELQSALLKLDGWKLVDREIEKTFRFPNFARAMVFVNKIVNPIEEFDHHPNIVIAYDRVTLSFFTHDEGGITSKDIAVAMEIEEIAK